MHIIADADTHISSETTGKRIPAEELIRRMDAAGIERALVWLHPNQTEDEPCDVDAQNAYIARMARVHTGRLMPMGWVDPRKTARSDLRGCIRRQREEYGFHGVKLNGAQNFYDLADEMLVLPAAEEIARAGGLMAFHSDAGENTHPDKVAAIAARYPEVPVLLVHMGVTACEAAVQAAVRCPNITLIGSGMKDYRHVDMARQILGAKRVCFGSDAPFGSMETVLAQYRQVLADAAEEERTQILGGNLLELMEMTGP